MRRYWVKSSWIENGGFRSRDFWGVSNKPTSSLDELHVMKMKTGRNPFRRNSLVHCGLGASRLLPILINVGRLQGVARTHPIPGRSKLFDKIEVLLSLSRDLSTGSAEAAKACARRRRTTFLLILAQLLQPWWRRLPEACIEVGEDEEEDGYEGEEDHAS